ncbi:type II secretion system F family protein [Clostridium saccharoperbutylacetonicum]|uniref:type II secretion system F family protein n=1 Tax=Clostridium saccharoperbutylacetonicum TaxID=36745 RepID=UPI0039EBED2D
MELFYISIFAGIIAFLTCNVIEYLALGDKGKNKQISNYYKFIKGDIIVAKRKKVLHKNNDFGGEITKEKYVMYSMPICVLIFMISYISSRSMGLAFFLSFLGLFYPKTIINNRIKKKKSIVNMQLIDALNSIVASLKAGLSINSALIKCSDDLESLYSLVKDKPMLEEFNKIKSDLNMGMSVDDTLRNFMVRMKMEDVDDFVHSVIIVRQKGGNLVEVMTNVTQMITDKIAIRREIEILTTSKKTEAKIITIIPIFIIISLSIFSFDYIRPLYDSFLGKVLIVVGCTFLFLNYFISKKVVDIQI